MRALSIFRLTTVALVAIVFGALFNYLFFAKYPGVSFFVFVVLLLAALLSFFYFYKIEFNKSAWWLALPILFFSGMVGVRDSMVLLVFNVLVTLGLLLVFVAHATGKSPKNYLFVDFLKTAIVLPLRLLGKTFSVLGRLLTINKNLKHNQKTGQILKGLVITIPIFLFFLALLASSDLVFGKLVSNVFSINISARGIAQLWWWFFAAFVCLGSWAFVLESSTTQFIGPPMQQERKYKFGKIEAGILFGAISFLFLAFVIVQIKYLFAGQNAISQFGFTYAEYAHKGFAELIFVALLTFVLIFATEKYLEKQNGSHAAWFKIFSGVLIFLVLVIMASAFLRLTTYEQAYGYTVPRILVQSFIVWLAAVFVWLCYKIVKSTPEHSFAFGVFVLVIAFFVFFNLLNPDAFVAKKNIDQFAKQGTLDTHYFELLSSDAMPEIAKLVNFQGYQNKYGVSLAYVGETMLQNKKYQLKDSPWQSFNFSRNHVLKLTANAGMQ